MFSLLQISSILVSFWQWAWNDFIVPKLFLFSYLKSTKELIYLNGNFYLNFKNYKQF